MRKGDSITAIMESEIREALRRLDALVEFCESEDNQTEDGFIEVEAHLLRADLEAVRSCVRAARDGRATGPGEEDADGHPITCEAFVDDGLTRKCARCRWWRTTHQNGSPEADR